MLYIYDSKFVVSLEEFSVHRSRAFIMRNCYVKKDRTVKLCQVKLEEGSNEFVAKEKDPLSGDVVDKTYKLSDYGKEFCVLNCRVIMNSSDAFRFAQRKKKCYILFLSDGEIRECTLNTAEGIKYGYRSSLVFIFKYSGNSYAVFDMKEYGKKFLVILEN